MVKSRRTMFDNAKNPLILQTKFEDFQRYTHEALFQFPKKERFLLCGQIQTATDEAMQLIIRFRLKYYKKTTLEDIDIKVGFLRTLVREAHFFQYISTGKLGEWIGQLDEIGRIIGGLKKFYSEQGKR
ncbi:MAG: diversity-generating retroelement protein Avd [Veillonellaceae bacterium]|nr:diversity-generating retroelement protein Avd [Veillonellaceae bacterium]